LEKNRLDHIKIGHFICSDHSDLLNKKSFKYFVDVQRKLPNSVILFLDYNLYKLKQFSFQCFRINHKFLETVNKLDIEEDEPDFFKKFILSKNLLTEVIITFSDDPQSIYFSLSAESENCDKKELDRKEKDDVHFNRENSYLYKKLYNIKILIKIRLRKNFR
jgi:hypothetical protein